VQVIIAGAVSAESWQPPPEPTCILSRAVVEKLVAKVQEVARAALGAEAAVNAKSVMRIKELEDVVHRMDASAADFKVALEKKEKEMRDSLQRASV
jgi:hypothetical protein